MLRETTNSASSSSERSPYEIKIQGQLDDRWAGWFHDVRITIEQSDDRRTITTLNCPAIDQAKLRGILKKIWDLNLTIISVWRVTDSTNGE
jgi:hypothetical protein